MSPPLDFMGEPIEEGDTIVYATGGSYTRLVEAKVIEVTTYEPEHSYLRGPQPRLWVNRMREGGFFIGQEKVSKLKEKDKQRRVKIDKIETVVVVAKAEADETVLDRLLRATTGGKPMKVRLRQSEEWLDLVPVEVSGIGYCEDDLPHGEVEFRGVKDHRLHHRALIEDIVEAEITE